MTGTARLVTVAQWPRPQRSRRPTYRRQLRRERPERDLRSAWRLRSSLFGGDNPVCHGMLRSPPLKGRCSRSRSARGSTPRPPPCRSPPPARCCSRRPRRSGRASRPCAPNVPPNRRHTRAASDGMARRRVELAARFRPAVTRHAMSAKELSARADRHRRSTRAVGARWSTAHDRRPRRRRRRTTTTTTSTTESDEASPRTPTPHLGERDAREREDGEEERHDRDEEAGHEHRRAHARAQPAERELDQHLVIIHRATRRHRARGVSGRRRTTPPQRGNLWRESGEGRCLSRGPKANRRRAAGGAAAYLRSIHQRRVGRAHRQRRVDRPLELAFERARRPDPVDAGRDADAGEEDEGA